MEWVVARDTSTLEETRLDRSGMPLLGAEPRCRWLPPQVLLDQERYVLTGRQVPREQWLDGVPPRTLATPVPGVFAVGDIRSGSTKRIATASGEGAAVVTLIHEWQATEAGARDCTNNVSRLTLHQARERHRAKETFESAAVAQRLSDELGSNGHGPLCLTRPSGGSGPARPWSHLGSAADAGGRVGLRRVGGRCPAGLSPATDCDSATTNSTSGRIGWGGSMQLWQLEGRRSSVGILPPC